MFGSVKEKVRLAFHSYYSTAAGKKSLLFCHSNDLSVILIALISSLSGRNNGKNCKNCLQDVDGIRAKSAYVIFLHKQPTSLSLLTWSL